MVAFEVYNVTLWNIVMTINEIEHGSCTLQINHNVSWIVTHRKSQLLDASVDIMIEKAIPILLVDYSETKFDTDHFKQTQFDNDDVILFIR